MVFIGYKFSTQNYDKIFEILFDSTEITPINEEEKHQGGVKMTLFVVETCATSLQGDIFHTNEWRDLGIRTMSSPKTYEILHNVAIVRLCVPESQRLTSVSVLPS